MPRPLILISIILGVLSLQPGTNAQNRYGPNYLPPSSVAVTDDVRALFTNAAALGYRQETQFYMAFPHQNNQFTQEFGSFLMLGNLAFSGEWVSGDATQFNATGQFYQRWQLALGTPLWRWLNLGTSLRWYGTIQHQPEWDCSLMARPFPWISAGTILHNIGAQNRLSPLSRSGIAWRPLGEYVTLAADITVPFSETDSDPVLTGYLEIELLPGIEISTAYDASQGDYRLGFNINFTNFGLSASGYNTHTNTRAGALFFHRSLSPYPTPFKAPGAQVMRVKLSGLIQEQPSLLPYNPLHSLHGISELLQNLADDPQIEAVLLELDHLACGFTKLLEIRQLLHNLQQSGKKVYCYSEVLTNSTYFLATACDKVYINPAGTAWINGLSATALYFKETLNKLGVTAEFEYTGKYKSAHERLTREDMSPADREQTNAFLDDFFTVFLEKVAHSREMTTAEVAALIDQGPFTAQRAVDEGLLDDVVYQDELKEKLAANLGRKVQLHVLKNKRYNPPFQTRWKYNQQRSDQIALIYVCGGITTGENRRDFSDRSGAGAETLTRAIRKARKNKAVKAIILRVDSPGGSTLASDLIWREVYLTTQGKDRKPVIVSMSDVAASGGYYIACPADSIVAAPTTLTGSIGVIAGKLEISALMDKLGMNTTTLKRGENAGMLTIYRPWTTAERKKIQEQVYAAYDKFTQQVADGRGMTQKEVKDLAGGRIYSGQQALEKGLVDQLGGLRKAIEIACQATGLEEEAVTFSVYPKWWQGLLKMDITALLRHDPLWQTLSPAPYQQARMYFNAWLTNNDENLFMLMPYWMIIE